jgi:hypothetical protein
MNNKKHYLFRIDTTVFDFQLVKELTGLHQHFTDFKILILLVLF